MLSIWHGMSAMDVRDKLLSVFQWQPAFAISIPYETADSVLLRVDYHFGDNCLGYRPDSLWMEVSIDLRKNCLRYIRDFNYNGGSSYGTLLNVEQFSFSDTPFYRQQYLDKIRKMKRWKRKEK